MRWKSTVSGLLLGSLVLGMATLQTQPTAQAADSVPPDPPSANVRDVVLPAKPPVKLSSHLDSLVQAARTASATMSPEEKSVRAGLAPSGAGSLSLDASNNP